MPIIYDKKTRVFNLQTPHTSYCMGLLDDKYLLHLYYGKRVEEYSDFADEIPAHKSRDWCANDLCDNKFSSDTLPLEYATYGTADMRAPSFVALNKDKNAINVFEFKGYEIFKGKKGLKGLPATYCESDKEATTLEITLNDALLDLEVILSYTVFEKLDAIAKSVRVKNNSKNSVELKRVMSSSTYLFDKDFDFVHLSGAWARERHIAKTPLGNLNISIDSKTGASSHIHSPFVALARKNATEFEGEVYGVNLVYSGNFLIEAGTDPDDTVRINAGINPFSFNWEIKPDEEFTSPEVVLTYSFEGFSKMSETYHELYRTRLVRGKYRDAERPVLINNWEATYFDFNEEKIVNIAKRAKDVGVELMVLDDGWFGKRNDDTSSLGDWFENKDKLPEGIPGLANKINDLGMKFGLWFEPEMVSEKSELYKKHPDWCIGVEGRTKTPSRNQLMLDLSRKDVRDYIVKSLSDILSSAPISYVKWDKNRNFTEAPRVGYSHEYILGLYDVLERLTTAFPDVLFEGCSGGGGRFDAGMLYYHPQIWTSDNTDAVERLYIQHGTSLFAPASSMGAHVSAVPNHQVGRTTPIKMRGDVAMVGQFGYELDLNTLSDEELKIVAEQIKTYKKIRKTVHFGKMTRLISPFEKNVCLWEYVSKDKKEVVLVYAVREAKMWDGLKRVRLLGIDENKSYKCEENGKVYRGDYLMNVGLLFDAKKDYDSKIIILKMV